MFQYVDQELRTGVGFGGRAFLEIGPRGPSRVGTPKTIPCAAIATKPEPMRMRRAIFRGDDDFIRQHLPQLGRGEGGDPTLPWRV